MRKRFLYVLLLIPLFSMAQTVENYSSWNSVIIDYKLNSNFYLKNESHFRRTNFLSDWQQILLRPSFHYVANKTLDIAAGYTYSRNFRNTSNFNENDIWEQLLLSHHSGASSFKHRFRFEQRFIDKVVEQPNGGFTTDGTNFKMRFRYRFTWGIPLFKIKDNKKLSLTAFDEIWLNTEEGIVPRSVNQNWFYSGVSYPIFKNASLGMGYMNAYAPVSNGFSSNHILQTTLKYHI